MDSMKNQNAITVIVCPRPTYYDNNGIRKFRKIEDFHSKEFRESAIIVAPLHTFDEEDDNRSPYTDITYPLVWCNEVIKDEDYRWCNFCFRLLDKITGYYLSGEFDKRICRRYAGFHKECIEPMVKNPYHPKHSLYVLTYTHIISNKRCYCCYCYKQSYHYCSICDFIICSECVQEQPLLTIDHQERHEHTLSYIPREASMTCDVCALDDRRYFIYICHQCDFVIHKECIYFPYIIKISRHEHRLSFTYSFLPRKWFCGVCREQFDENYGGYSCAKGCCYVVHSRCAIDNNVWDGKELKGKLEDTYEDTMPLKEICDEIIQHFSHHHYMKLHKEIDKSYEEKHRCQACALPFYDGDIFSCMECDFVFHKVCAYLPLKKQHAMHPHPLVLREGNLQTRFSCSACQRKCNSFQYECGTRNCYFHLDVHCASISEPLDLHCHIHLLFLPSKSESTRICSICQVTRTYYLECGECDFALCFGCATLPKKFMYKHDEHPLLFSFGEDVSGQYWCDVCEMKINPKHGIYFCNDCKVTLHVKCLLGENMYILPGKTVIKKVMSYGKIKNDIIHKTRLTQSRANYLNKKASGPRKYTRF